MVFEATGGTTKPALISFVPRQVLLEKQSMKNKSSYETLENGKTLKSKQKQKQKKSRGQMTLLLHSIAAYLDSIGFSKTLTALRSESPLEIDDWKAHSLDLEDMYHKFLETSECPTEANMKGSKEQDSQNDGTGKKDEGESKCDASEELVCKKKRKKNSDCDAGMETKSVSPGIENGSAICVSKSNEKLPNAVIDDLHIKSKEKKKNKIKLVSDSLGDSIELVQSETFKEMAEKMGDESQPGNFHTKSKDKKRNKNKLTFDSCDENTEQVGSETLQDVVTKKNKDLKPLGGENKIDYQLPDSVAENISNTVVSDEANTKIKDKKKKHKLKDCEFTGDLNQTDFKKEDIIVSEVSVVAVEKKGSKKRKRLASEEKESGVDDKIASKESNHCKTEVSEENKEMEILPKESTILAGNGYLNPGKKKKSETSEVGTDKVHKTSLPLEDLTEVKGPGGCDGHEKVDAHANGILVKNGKGGGFTPKPTKKEHKGSVEPKTINAFQRVKVEEVKFVDKRLQDNSYWAKGGADSGYGAKAQEVLGQVRGRDFRHEKTKKKRGSYRGGQIDLQSHSIKFNNSDDDE